MNLKHLQSEAENQLLRFKVKSVGTHTLSVGVLLELLYRAHEKGQQRDSYNPLASIDYALRRIQDVPGIEQRERRALMDKLMDMGITQSNSGDGLQPNDSTKD